MQPPGVWYHGIRYFIAFVFLTYGGVKLFDIQFNREYQPYMYQAKPADDLKGSEIVWRFMGHSRVYHFMVGLGEVTAAVLLLWTRTAPLGAVLYFPLIANVVAIDLLFTVPFDATTVAVGLLVGDLLLLYVDRERIRQVTAALLRPASDAATWRQVLAGWGIAIVLVIALAVAAFFVPEIIWWLGLW